MVSYTVPDGEVLELHGTGAGFDLFRRVEDAQPEAIGVSLHGVSAEAPLVGQIILEEGGEVGGKINHRNPYSGEPVP